MASAEQGVPADCMRDAKGRFVPRSLIKPIDLARHELVCELVARAKATSTQLAETKRQLLADIAAFLELSAERFGVSTGGIKGNVTLTSFDGRFRVVRAIQDRIVFDEGLLIAKGLVDECVREWARGADDRVRALVEHAFQTDKAGRISTERVLSLRRLEIESEPWSRAMAAIEDSITVASSTTYVRVYERVGDEGDTYRPIPLDLSAL